MIDINKTTCCGLDEIFDLEEETKPMLLNISERFLDEKTAFYVFSDVSYSSSGKNLAKMIKKLKLGTITTTKYKTNPNSGNKLKIYVWSVDSKKLRDWHYKN